MQFTSGLPRLQSSRLQMLEEGFGLSKSLIKKLTLYMKDVLLVPDQLTPTRAVCDMYDKVRGIDSGYTIN